MKHYKIALDEILPVLENMNQNSTGGYHDGLINYDDKKSVHLPKFLHIHEDLWYVHLI